MLSTVDSIVNAQKVRQGIILDNTLHHRCYIHSNLMLSSADSIVNAHKCEKELYFIIHTDLNHSCYIHSNLMPPTV